MEKNRRLYLPWAANVLTLAVMVAATWWSSEQGPGPAVAATAVVEPANISGSPTRQPTASPIQTSWPTQTRLLRNNGAKPASFAGTRLR
jgi:hypothetical protein